MDVSFSKESNLIDFFVVGFLCFMAGFFAGDRFRKIKWSLLDWHVLKWNDGSLGYRLTPPTTKVKKGEKVFIALKVDLDSLPSGEEIQLFESE